MPRASQPGTCPAVPALANKWGGIALVPSCGCEKCHRLTGLNKTSVLSLREGRDVSQGCAGLAPSGGAGESSPRLGSFWKRPSSWAQGLSSHVKAHHSDLCFHRHVSSSDSGPSLPLTRTLVMTWGPPVSSRVTPQLRILHLVTSAKAFSLRDVTFSRSRN